MQRQGYGPYRTNDSVLYEKGPEISISIACKLGSPGWVLEKVGAAYRCKLIDIGINPAYFVARMIDSEVDKVRRVARFYYRGYEDVTKRKRDGAEKGGETPVYTKPPEVTNCRPRTRKLKKTRRIVR